MHTELGAGYYSRGQYAVALQELRKALAADSAYAPAYSILGLVHAELREDKQAEAYFQRAVELSPNYSEAHNNFGLFLCQRGRVADALKHFESALSNPLYATPEKALANAGNCAVEKGDLAQAELYFVRALKRVPNQSTALLGMAEVHYRQGRWLAARSLLRQVSAQFGDAADMGAAGAVAWRARGASTGRPRGGGQLRLAIAPPLSRIDASPVADYRSVRQTREPAMSEVFQADFGARLKAAREAQNMAVADVAAKLKLTPRQIEALEEEDLSHLPSEIFVRGFVRNYARLVGLEPDSLIAPVDVQAEVSEAITAPNAGLVVDSSGIRRWLVYPMLVLAAFLILVAALYHWLRQGEDTLITTPPELATQTQTLTPTPAPAAPLVTPAPAPAPAAAPAADAAVITPLALPNVVTPPASDVKAPANAEPAMATAPAAVKPAAPEAEAAPSNGGGSVQSGTRGMRFEPAQDAWIQVVDGKGNRFSRLVRAGTAESFYGEPPFRLVVGEAALVKLTYNGHSIDLTPFIGQKVARLTLE